MKEPPVASSTRSMRWSPVCPGYWPSTAGRSGGGPWNASDRTAWSMPTLMPTHNSLLRATAPSEAPDMAAGAPEERRQGVLGDREVRGRSLLAIFAHPDDESLACGGLLAWCAHLGATVSLLCVTDGRHDQERSLGELRAQELDAACRALGVADLVLLHYEDGMLPWVDPGELEADIAAAIERLCPDIVITFDEDGLYWHPDHIAVHERTTAAVAAFGVGGPALYYVTIPPGGMRAVVQYARETLA